MKKCIAFIMCILMLAGVFTGCTTTLKDGDKGMVIDIYLTNELYNFDPGLGINDTDMVKFYSMIYEGLTRLDAKGNWEKALMKEYRVYDTEESFKIQIDLNETYWTDGRRVQAQDVVYAWKRILESHNSSEYASLLYSIKNARAVKNAEGDITIDDLGLKDIKTYTLEIEFETKINVDDFFKLCASPALVPLREDIVTKDDDWAKKSNTLITNGPFVIKEIDHGNTNKTSGILIRLERSNYYYLSQDKEKSENLDKYVIPYRMITHYEYGGLAEQLKKFEEGTLLYLGEIAIESREQYKDQATVTDELATHTYFFNLNNELLAKKEVRQALSMAIDRQAIANALVFAKPATGIVSYKVNDADTKTYFREVADQSGALINVAGDINGAKSLLKKAGVSGGEFTLTVRNTEADVFVAEMVIDAWEQLGFKVTLDKVSFSYHMTSETENAEAVYDDIFTERFNTGDFDVISIDYCMLATEAFYPLSRFALEFSGNGIDYSNSNYDLKPHITGYNSKAYNDLINKAYTASTAAEKLSALHDAEKQLMDDMPVMPIYFMQDAYLINKDQLSGYKENYYAVRDFRRMKQKDYYEWKMAHSALDSEE